MFTIAKIVEKLNFFDIECDIEEVEKLIKSLRLEPIFENENGDLYYDDESYETLKSCLEGKGVSAREIKEAQVVEQSENLVVVESQTALTIDNSGKNIEIIADTLSKRISQEIADFIKKNISTEEAFKAGVFKRDNEILSKKLQDTINDNKKLIEKLRQMEYELRKYRPVLGNIYVKIK